MSITTPSPVSSRRSVGLWCAFAPFGPDATIVSNEMPSAPNSRIARSTPHDTSRSVIPGRSSAPTLSIAWSASSMALSSRASSPGSFTARNRSAMPPVGTRSGDGSSACSFSVSALCAAMVTDSSSKPMLRAPDAETTSENQSLPAAMRTTR